MTTAGDVDKSFIVERLREKGKTMKDLAFSMSLDPTSLSKRIGMKREFSAQEACEVAEYLELPIDRALQTLGLKPPPVGDFTVKQAGWIDGEQKIHEVTGGLTDILHKNRDAVVYKLQTASAPSLDVKMLTGTRIVTLPLTKGIDPMCFRSVSLVVEKGTGRVFIGRVMGDDRSGYVVYGGLIPINKEIQIESTAPILAIHPI